MSSKSSVICLLTVLTISIIFPQQSNAFKFDMWNAGLSLKKAEEIAKLNKIKLFGKTTNPRGNALEKNRKLYSTSYFREGVLVELFFTKVSILLYEVRISWNNNITIDKVYNVKRKLESALRNKYGKFDSLNKDTVVVAKGKIKKDCEREIHIKTNGNDQVVMRFVECSNALSLIYTNKTLENISNIEILALKDEENNDASKF